MDRLPPQEPAQPRSQPPTTAAKADLSRRRSWLLPKWLWAVLTLLAWLAACAPVPNLLGDHANANVATVFFALAAMLVLLVWFCFFSGAGRRTRLSVAGGVIAVCVVLTVLFRVGHLTGDLLPTLTLRFRSHADRWAANPLPDGPVEAPVDLRTTSEFDFPQFLGPKRDAAVDSVALVRDWSVHAPEIGGASRSGKAGRVSPWSTAMRSPWSSGTIGAGHVLQRRDRPDRVGPCDRERYDGFFGGVGPRSTPTIDGGLVYALGATGRLLCLDGGTGECRWEVDLPGRAGMTPEQDAKTRCTAGRPRRWWSEGW